MINPRTSLLLSTVFFANTVLYADTLEAQQAAITAKDTAIWTEPNRGSDQLTELTQDTSLDVMKRKGGWYLVKLEDDQTGWVPLLHLRFQNEEESKEKSIADILRQTAEMPTASGVTSGVRGMTKDKLNDENNDSEPSLDKMDNYIPTDDDMKFFREEGDLNRQNDLNPEQN